MMNDDAPITHSNLPTRHKKKEYVALLEGHLDPASLPLREEEEALFYPSDDGDEAGAARAGHYDVRPSVRPSARTPVYLSMDPPLLTCRSPFPFRRRASPASGSRCGGPSTSSASSTSPAPPSTAVRNTN